MSKGVSLEKSIFVLSFAALTFLYGFAACAWGLFPKHLLLDAWGQAERTGIVSFVERQLPGYSPEPPHFLDPEVYKREGVQIPEPDEVQPGLTLITSVGWEPELKLIDRKGRVMHSWQVDLGQIKGSAAGPEKGNVHGSHLLPNGDLLINLEYGGMLRLNSCGEVLWQVPRGHHSITRAEDGSFWVSTVSEEPQSGSENYPNGFPGLDKPVFLDRVRHIAEDGSILNTINVLDVIYKNDLERYIPKSYHKGNIDTDITHLNDVEPLSPSMAEEYPLFEGGDLLVSLKHLDLVFVFNPESMKVRWHASSPFIYQHDPDFIGNGWIGVFNNNTDFTKRGEMLGGSQIVAIQPHTGLKEILFPTHRSAPFYTNAGGKWQKLKNGNLLLTEAHAGRVVEVAPDGHTVWEWIHKPYENSYEDAKIPEVTEGTRYDLTRKEVASWPCSSVDSIDVTAQKQQTAP